MSTSSGTSRAWRALAVLVFAAGCYPKVAPPGGALSPSTIGWASGRWPGATAASLAAGHDRFIAACNGCHGYPDLVAIGADRWPHLIDTMGTKAHFGPEEKEAVLRYVLAARFEQTGGP